MSASPDNRSSDIRHSMASAPPVQLQLLIFNFTGFDRLIERGYRPSCRHNCPPAEKVETITYHSICAHRSPLRGGGGGEYCLASRGEQTRTDRPPPNKNAWIRHCLESFKLHYFFLVSNTQDEYFAVGERNSAGAPNDSFLLNALKTLFWLSKVFLDLKKSILSDAVKSVSVRSS